MLGFKLNCEKKNACHNTCKVIGEDGSWLSTHFYVTDLTLNPIQPNTAMMAGLWRTQRQEARETGVQESFIFWKTKN